MTVSAKIHTVVPCAASEFAAIWKELSPRRRLSIMFCRRGFKSPELRPCPPFIAPFLPRLFHLLLLHWCLYSRMTICSVQVPKRCNQVKKNGPEATCLQLRRRACEEKGLTEMDSARRARPRVPTNKMWRKRKNVCPSLLSWYLNCW